MSCGVVVHLVFALFVFSSVVLVSKAECEITELQNNDVGPLQVCGREEGETVLRHLCAEPTTDKIASVLCRHTSCGEGCNLFNYTVIKQRSLGYKYQCEAGDMRRRQCDREIDWCDYVINTLNCACSLGENCSDDPGDINYCANNTCSCMPTYEGDNCQEEVCEIGDIDTEMICESPSGERDWFPLCPSIDSLAVIRSLCRTESSCRSDCNTVNYTFSQPDTSMKGYDVICNDSATGLSECELSFGNCTTGVLSTLICFEDPECECENGGFCYNDSCLCPPSFPGEFCRPNSANESLVTMISAVIGTCLLIILIITLCCCVFALAAYIKRRFTDLKNLESRIIFRTRSVRADIPEAREEVEYASVKLDEMLPSTTIQNTYSDHTVSDVFDCSCSNSKHNTAADTRNRTYTEQTSVENDIYKPVLPKCISNPAPDTSRCSANSYESAPAKPLRYSGSIVQSHRQRVEKVEGDTLKQGESYFSKESDYEEPPSDIPGIYNTMSCLKFREIIPACISLNKKIGTGCFGMVHLAEWTPQPDTEPIDVAVKCLKESADSHLRISFLTEAAIMGQFDHPNVLRLLGVVSVDKPYMLVVELMEGDLTNLLITISSVPFDSESVSQYLLSVTRDVVRGMEYLSSKHFVHRDLAARNVLVGSDKVCRIGDFGLSKRMDDDKDYYKVNRGGVIAVRWTAPEALFYRRYSEKSDVWSLGMTLFEVWSLGQRPWGQYSNLDVISLVSSGTFQGPPTGCPREMYSLMVNTWRADPTQRPTFREIAELLEREDAILLRFPDELKSERAGQLGNDPELSVSLFSELRN